MVKYRQNAIWIALFVALAGGLTFAVWQSSNQPHQRHAVGQTSKSPEGHSPVLATPESADNRIADYTWWLGAFTLALVIVSCFQIGFLVRADRTSSKLADISDQQRKISEAQRIVDHRPRLRVRHVSIETAETDNPTFSHNDEIKGGLVVVNAGGTKATIIDSFYRIVFSKTGMPMKSPLDNRGPELIMRKTALNIGESLGVGLADIVDIGSESKNSSFLAIRGFDREWKVYVLGQIQYRDEGGYERFMGFCREWSGEGTFRAIDNPDYEYED